MIKKIALGILGLMLATSCNKEYEKALKNNDAEQLLKYAHEFYQAGKYSKSIDTFEKVIPKFRGKAEHKNLLFTYAKAEFANKEYIRSGKHFKDYARTFRKDNLAEEALYLSAISYYKDSPKYSLTQESTNTAIKEIQLFINKYPNSNKVADLNAKIKELRVKLEKKHFEIAKSYFKTKKYKASGVALKNVLNDYPDTIYKEQIIYYLFLSNYELAVNSVDSKKEVRLKNTITVYKRFNKMFTNSEFTTELDKKIEKVNKELTNLESKS